LTREVDGHLAAASATAAGRVHAIVVPHAGMMFSGPVGAWAYKAVASQAFDVAVLAGPSHFFGFDGVALYPEGAFATPLGLAAIDGASARRIAASPIVRALPGAHDREHALEMQLPFLQRLFPSTPIVPLLMGSQTEETIVAFGAALADAYGGRSVLLVASSDLSHYFDARTAESLDARVQGFIDTFDPEGLLEHFLRYPEHERGRYVACGGGPLISVMFAARALGATSGRVLRYAHSGNVSGDHAQVVGYVAAAFDAALPE
jgi:AmmeMemoRadiSam system protein B